MAESLSIPNDGMRWLLLTISSQLLSLQSHEKEGKAACPESTLGIQASPFVHNRLLLQPQHTGIDRIITFDNLGWWSTGSGESS